MYSSQIHVNLFSLKKVTSLPGVAANQSGGKASGDSRLRLSKSRSRLPETILSMVTMRNLRRYAGTSLPYWPTLNSGHVAMWLRSCVQGFSQENTSTALQTEEHIAQGPKLNRLKNRKNLRTTGFNLCESLFSKGERSVHSTLSVKEGTQANISFAGFHRSFSTNIRSNNLDERVLAMELKQMVEKCKNKDGRYGNLIQIIGSFSTINLAYLMVKSNLGISAKGVSDKTLDRINLKTLQKISEDTLSGAIEFSPVRRVLIPKPGKSVLRPLGVSSPREKIVQKAIELVLTAIFEEIFLDCSHGSRPNRSRHSALKHLQLKIGNASTYTWVIEGDIKGCFDNIPHSTILKGLRRKVDCPATLNLIKQILGAGYILNEDLKKVGRKRAQVHKSNIGTSQSIVLSPLFSNIVIHELDVFIEDELKRKFIKGKTRRPNQVYRRLKYRIERENDLKKKRKLVKQRLKVSSKDMYDPNFHRLHYVRYVDDWVILVAGSFKEAKVIRDQVSNKLKRLGLTLNLEKTRITSLKNGKCRFLGIDFFIRENNDKHHKPTTLVRKNNTIIKQRFAPRIILYAPILELIIKLKDKSFVKRSRLGEFFPIGKSNCIPLTHPQILQYFNSRIRGILNYYSCVQNRNELWSIVRFLNYSCALTLARKYKLKSLAKTFKKFGRDLKFVNEKGKEYKIFRPGNLRMLPENRRFRVNENTDIDQLLS
jgi:group II intron reverse transcriptase/maturase